MDRYFPPMCDVMEAVPGQGLLTASNDSYYVDPVDPGFIYPAD